MQVRSFSSPQEVAEFFADDLCKWIRDTSEPFSIALSGGSTPKILFQHWANSTQASDWNQVHFYWGDERCVPPDSDESNYGVTKDLFLDPTTISEANIHRVLGEADPETEATRYSELIRNNIRSENELPQFDVVLLGMGTDGHTASIFPNQMHLLESEQLCAVATHPDTDQRRVTLTGKTIANAKRIVFLITGANKKEKFAAIANHSEESNLWPATRFLHLPNTTVYVDQAVE